MQIVTPTSSKSRHIRRPVHTFNIEHRPWQIQPFLIAPVLPGETMRNAVLQSRCVTDPIQNPIIGWWLEHYLFYVKFRDLDARDDLATMVLDPEATIATLNEAANEQYYHGWTTVPWTKLCVKRIVEEYFRVEGEAWDTYTANGLPIASINRDSVLDSAVTDTAYLANISEEESITVGVDDSFTAQEVHDMMQKWNWQREHGLTDLDYDDWLRLQGVSVPQKDDEELRYKPELLRFSRAWQYPSNTIDPSDGSPSSAVSWSIQERADKDRFFTEPGFIVGVTVTRPKVYLSKQNGSAVGLMTTANQWFPKMLENDAFSSFVSGATDTFLASQTDSYWVDLRDLLYYGDQFANFTLTDTGKNMVALPTAALQKRYVATTDIDNLFVNTTAGVGKVVQDGVATFMIATRQRERSATV